MTKGYAIPSTPCSIVESEREMLNFPELFLSVSAELVTLIPLVFSALTIIVENLTSILTGVSIAPSLPSSTTLIPLPPADVLI